MNNTGTTTQEETDYKVMRLLEDNPDMTQRELAQSLGVSVGSVNYYLRALVDKGWIKIKNFAHSRNKFGYVYLLTPSGVAEKALITQRILQRKMDECDALKIEIESMKSELVKDDIGRLKISSD